MTIQYLIFLLPFYPIVKYLFDRLSGRAEQANIIRQQKRQNRSAIKNSIFDSLLLGFYSLAFIVAGFYADLKLVWTLLGSIYLITAIFILTMTTLAHLARKHYPQLAQQADQPPGASAKKQQSWPKWHSNVLCLFNYSVLVVWIYAWRHLFT